MQRHLEVACDDQALVDAKRWIGHAARPAQHHRHGRKGFEPCALIDEFELAWIERVHAHSDAERIEDALAFPVAHTDVDRPIGHDPLIVEIGLWHVVSRGRNSVSLRQFSRSRTVDSSCFRAARNSANCQVRPNKDDMSESPVLIAKDARGVATVAINRPKVRNAIDDTVIRLLTDAFAGLGADGATRIVVLTGSGSAFCAGADLDWMRRMASASEAKNVASAKTISAMLRSLNELAKPTIARINGAAYAAGTGLIAACDIAVAPSTIGPYVVAAIGAKAARRYFLTGEPCSAADACRIGLVHQVVPETGLDAAVEELISALLAGGPQSQSRAKRLIAEVAHRRVDDALEALTARSIADARASPEGREGIAAFLEKRKPAWRN